MSYAVHALTYTSIDETFLQDSQEKSEANDFSLYSDTCLGIVIPV